MAAHTHALTYAFAIGWPVSLTTPEIVYGPVAKDGRDGTLGAVGVGLLELLQLATNHSNSIAPVPSRHVTAMRRDMWALLAAISPWAAPDSDVIHHTHPAFFDNLLSRERQVMIGRRTGRDRRYAGDGQHAGNLRVNRGAGNGSGPRAAQRQCAAA